MRTQTIYLSLVLVLLHPDASAQWVQTKGPYGSDILSFAVLGTNLFAGTDKGGHDVVPSFQFVSLQGDTISSSALRGKLIVVDFWSSTCGPCLRSVPALARLVKKYLSDSRVVILLVNNGWESIDKARECVRTRSLLKVFSRDVFAYDQGCKVFKSFGFKSNPSTIIIGLDNKVLFRHSGFIENVDVELDNVIQQHLPAQKP